MSVYDQDGLRSIDNHEFIQDPEFQRTVSAVGEDYWWQWRVHGGL